MKRSRKTLFALLLALVMALGLTATAWAAEGNVTVNLPDGFIEQTPNVPMDPSDPVYKIHFTKVVEQAGTCAPGKETFKFEAVNHVIDAAQYPDVQRSVEIETNGAGTYQGTLTITGIGIDQLSYWAARIRKTMTSASTKMMVVSALASFSCRADPTQPRP